MSQNMRNIRFVLASTAFLTGAGGALAEVHEVQILNGAYFPPTVYAKTGDSIVFYNASFSEHVVGAPTKEWSSDKIPVDGSFTLLLDETTPARFEGEAHDATYMEGEIILTTVVN